LKSDNVNVIAPVLERYGRDTVEMRLWARPQLSRRDRSLVAVTALVVDGQVAQIPFHLNRAMDRGLTRDQAGEVIAHVAFYAGWPNAFSAVPVVKDVFEKRGT
jgi:4-carboxymuconolactone decarboxylase